jgi:hypothetical protein
MISFKSFLSEELLNEKLITFGGKAYPRFGNVVILAGGAGSGKGFVKDKLLGIEGYSFDVDELKLLSTRTPIIIDKVKSELGIDLTKYDTSKNKMALKDPEVVKELHAIIGDYLKLDDRKKKAVFNSIISADPERKPNLIFDVTMKSMKQFDKYTSPVVSMGYHPKNIHLVWIVNDVTVAMQQNRERSRTVPEDILIDTHEGAAMTMREILSMTDRLKSTVNGDIVLAFNQVGVDNKFVSGPDDRAGKTKKSGYFKEAKYVYVKRAGKPIDKTALTQDVMDQVKRYVPQTVSKVYDR